MSINVDSIDFKMDAIKNTISTFLIHFLIHNVNRSNQCIAFINHANVIDVIIVFSLIWMRHTSRYRTPSTVYFRSAKNRTSSAVPIWQSSILMRFPHSFWWWWKKWKMKILCTSSCWNSKSTFAIVSAGIIDCFSRVKDVWLSGSPWRDCGTMGFWWCMPARHR